VCHPIDLPEGYHAVPRGQAWQLNLCWEECCPRGAAWSGGARPTGYHTDLSVQDRSLGPSSRRRTSSSIEKPREAARTFLLVNPAASLRWRRRRSAGRTSWPISRIQTVVPASKPGRVIRDPLSVLFLGFLTSGAATRRRLRWCPRGAA
jgi:hypothetical protein